MKLIIYSPILTDIDIDKYEDRQNIRIWMAANGVLAWEWQKGNEEHPDFLLVEVTEEFDTSIIDKFGTYEIYDEGV